MQTNSLVTSMTFMFLSDNVKQFTVQKQTKSLFSIKVLRPISK